MTVMGLEPPRRDPTPQYLTERDACLKYFEKWSEQDQVEFVEYLLSQMCHYQHNNIDTFLKPMLQRDFISLLPGERWEISGVIGCVRCWGSSSVPDM